MADRVIHARAAFMSYTSEGPYALVVSGRVFTADPRWRPGDDDQPIPVVVIPLADYERLAALCQCRPPRAGQDGYTCPRCEVDGAVPYLKASLAAAEARAEKVEGEVRYLRAVVAWRKGLAESETCESCKCSDCQAWLAANPEPQPPEGVAP